MKTILKGILGGSVLCGLFLYAPSLLMLLGLCGLAGFVVGAITELIGS